MKIKIPIIIEFILHKEQKVFQKNKIINKKNFLNIKFLN